MQITISSKNQVVIPKDVRRQLKLSPGDKLIVKLEGDSAHITKAPSVEDELYKILHMSAPTDDDVVSRVRKLRDEW